MKNRKRLVSIVAGALAILLLLSLIIGMIPVSAKEYKSQLTEELKGEISDLKSQQDEIQEQIDALKDQIKENMSEMEKITAEKNVIDQEIGLLNQQILNINDQIVTYGLLIADKQDELDEAKAKLKELSEQNKERIRAMEEAGELSYWSVLFKASSFSDLLDRLNMIEEIAAADQRRLEALNKAAEAVAVAQAELETEKDALEEVKAELDAKQAELAGKREEADALLVELNAKGEAFEALKDEAEEDEEALIAEIAAAEKAYNDEIARLKEEERKREEERRRREEEERRKAEEALKQQQAAAGGVAPPSSVTNGVTWVMPCSYKYLSSPYGWRIHPVYGYRKFHSGVDLAAPSGNPIYASRSGRVTIATYSDSAGYYVTLNHGDGFSTSYLHMTHYVVAPGDYVAAGQVIGYIGSTGVSTGPHLHFSIYYNGNTLNPADYINFY